MKRIQTKLTVWFVVISIIPVLTLGLFSYHYAVSSVTESANHTSALLVHQVGKTLDNKVGGINKYMDIIFNNPEAQKLLQETDFRVMDGAAYMRNLAFDQWCYSIFYGDADIEALYLSNETGCYTYNGTPGQYQVFTEAQVLEYLKAANGSTVWMSARMLSDMGIEIEQDTFLVGRLMKDTTVQTSLAPIGYVCAVVGRSFTDSILDVSADGGSEFLVVDADGRVLMSREGTHTFQNLDVQDGVLAAESGFEQLVIDGQRYFVSFDSAQWNGWKLLNCVPESEYYNNLRHIAWTTILLSVVCMMVICLMAVFVSRHISQPVRQLLNATNRVCRKQFDVQLERRTDDELGELVDGFNRMVKNLNDVFLQLRREEEEKRRAQVRTLQYQINPHFLYNTLGSISMIASVHGDTDVSDMVATLSRLLRNAIRYADKLITVEKELDNLRDFLSLMQVRYQNRIEISFETDPAAMQCRMPGMLLQPLAENALLHGLSEKLNQNSGNAHLKISAAVKDETLLLGIHDNGCGMTQEQIREIFCGTDDGQGTHIGIRNIHDRIVLYFGNGYGLQLESETGKYTTVLMRLPVLLEEPEQRE